MGPYLIIITAVILLGIAFWFWYGEKLNGEPAKWFFVWLFTSAFTGIFAAVAFWVKDATISRSFFTASDIFLVIDVFLIFVFARSFGHRADFTLLFWSLPMQFAVAGLIVNARDMYTREGERWMVKGNFPIAWVSIAVLLIYSSLAIIHMISLLSVLKRRGREKEARQVITIFIALVILFLTNVVGATLMDWAWAGSFSIPLVDIGNLVGTLVLVYALLGVPLGKAREGVV